MKRFLQCTLIIVLLAMTFQVTTVSGQFFNMQSPLIGKPAADFTLKTLQKDQLSLSEFRGDENTIIFFWATWCPHCRTQLMVLNENREDIAKQNIKLALVDLGESESVVRNYIEKNDIQLDVFLDLESSLDQTYNLIGLPTFIFVNKDGIVKDVQHSLPKDLGTIFAD